MAAITPASNDSGQGIFKIFKFTTCADGDTWTGILGAKAYWAMGTGNPTTQASAGISVEYAPTTGVFTFRPGENSLACSLFVVV